MPNKFPSKIKIVLFACLILLLGGPVWFNKSMIENSSDEIVPPIDAKDEVGRLIQMASENFFFRDFEKAAENYQQAISLLKERKKFKRVGKTYESLGDMYKFMRDIEEAEKSYRQAREQHRQIKNLEGEAHALKKAGDLYMDRGQFQPALKWYQEAVAVIEKEGPSMVQGEVYELAGRAYWKNDRIDEAVTHVTRARDIFAEIKFAMGYEHMEKLIKAIQKKSPTFPPTGTNT